MHFKVPLQVLWLSRLDLIGPAAFRPDPSLQRPRSGRHLGDHGFEGERAVIHETNDWSYAHPEWSGLSRVRGTTARGPNRGSKQSILLPTACAGALKRGWGSPPWGW